MLTLIAATLIALNVAPALSQSDLADLLTERAEAHGAAPEDVIDLATCEGGGYLNPAAIGLLGERGMGQWLPGRGNHADMSPTWTAFHIDLVDLYRRGDPNAVWHDADTLAWFVGEAPRGLVRSGWVTCSQRLGL